MLEIDGSQGEGGGQLLRSALALSLVMGQPFRMINIRARRPRPGLMRQHLTAVSAATEVGRASVEGAAVGSREITFTPGSVRSGHYSFSTGTAGSATLVFQTVLPALALAKGRSDVVLEGGTHNPHAPTFEYLSRVFLPLVERMGPRCAVMLERPGFYPAGGGRIRAQIEPAPGFGRLELLERGHVVGRTATAVVARLPRSIAQRELAVLQERLGWDASCMRAEEASDSAGPGNAVWAEVESEQVTELFTGFGEKGVSAERVAGGVATEAAQYIEADVPVGRHLADQLLLPMALGNGGAFTTLALSGHSRAHIMLLRAILGTVVDVRAVGPQSWLVVVGERPSGQPRRASNSP